MSVRPASSIGLLNSSGLLATWPDSTNQPQKKQAAEISHPMIVVLKEGEKEWPYPKIPESECIVIRVPIPLASPSEIEKPLVKVNIRAIDSSKAGEESELQLIEVKISSPALLDAEESQSLTNIKAVALTNFERQKALHEIWPQNSDGTPWVNRRIDTPDTLTLGQKVFKVTILVTMATVMGGIFLATLGSIAYFVHKVVFSASGTFTFLKNYMAPIGVFLGTAGILMNIKTIALRIIGEGPLPPVVGNEKRMIEEKPRSLFSKGVWKVITTVEEIGYSVDEFFSILLSMFIPIRSLREIKVQHILPHELNGYETIRGEFFKGICIKIQQIGSFLGGLSLSSALGLLPFTFSAVPLLTFLPIGIACGAMEHVATEWRKRQMYQHMSKIDEDAILHIELDCEDAGYTGISEMTDFSPNFPSENDSNSISGPPGGILPLSNEFLICHEYTEEPEIKQVFEDILKDGEVDMLKMSKSHRHILTTKIYRQPLPNHFKINYPNLDWTLVDPEFKSKIDRRAKEKAQEQKERWILNPLEDQELDIMNIPNSFELLMLIRS